jgi:hypothetical protein
MKINCELYKEKVLSYFKSTVIWLGFYGSREQLDTILTRHLSEGKRVADFVGMIGQSALCLFFAMYLNRQTEERTSIF